MQFSVVRIIIFIYPILKYYKTLHILSCKCFDFTGHEILLIARSCVIFGQFREIVKFQKAWWNNLLISNSVKKLIFSNHWLLQNSSNANNCCTIYSVVSQARYLSAPFKCLSVKQFCMLHCHSNRSLPWVHLGQASTQFWSNISALNFNDISCCVPYLSVATWKVAVCL